MEGFINKLERILCKSEYKNWKVICMPDIEKDGVILELDDEAIAMHKLCVEYPYRG